VLFACARADTVGALEVHLLYDGPWTDSSSRAYRIRRELTDSLARFGAVTVRDLGRGHLTTR
jgi:hypothetical protein